MDSCKCELAGCLRLRYGKYRALRLQPSKADMFALYNRR